MTHCLTDYINFCVDMVSPVKEVKAVNNKMAAFRSRARETIRAAQLEVKCCLRKSRTATGEICN